jgi:flagellar biosynthesis protein FliQ
VNPDEAISLVATFFRTALLVTTPVLAAALVAGVIVGVLQTATQVNEASISFLVKVCAVLAVGIVLGPQLSSYLLHYTRESFEAIAQVVR